MSKNINLFWRQTRNPKIREKEKENNVTHAFLITISKHKDFLNYLLKRFKIKNVSKKDVEVFFQVDKRTYAKKTREKVNKYLLFINSDSNKNEKSQLEKERKEKDVPDGLIMDKKTAIIIETKVSSCKNSSQISRYNQNFLEGKGEIIPTTWEAIHKYSSSYMNCKRDKASLESFLIHQFKEYLGVVHLGGFEGIPFFKEDYNKENATEVLKNLIRELREKDWFKKYQLNISDRPITGNWTYWCHKGITEKNPRNFPHYSVYVSENIFGIDCLFHKNELKKIINNPFLFSRFTHFIRKISKDPDYYFRAEHYRLLQNKENAKARQGASYGDFDFTFQIKRFVKNHKNWKEQLKKYLDILINENIKQFTILKKVYYKDRMHKGLCESENVFDFIEEMLKETTEFYNFMYGIYKK